MRGQNLPNAESCLRLVRALTVERHEAGTGAGREDWLCTQPSAVLVAIGVSATYLCSRSEQPLSGYMIKLQPGAVGILEKHLAQSCLPAVGAQCARRS